MKIDGASLIGICSDPEHPASLPKCKFGVSGRRFRFNRQAVSVETDRPFRSKAAPVADGFGPDFGEPPLRDTSYLCSGLPKQVLLSLL